MAELIYIHDEPYKKATDEDELSCVYARFYKKTGWKFCKKAKNAQKLIKIDPKDILQSIEKTDDSKISLNKLVIVYPLLKKHLPIHDIDIMRIFFQNLEYTPDDVFADITWCITFITSL